MEKYYKKLIGRVGFVVFGGIITYGVCKYLDVLKLFYMKTKNIDEIGQDFIQEINPDPLELFLEKDLFEDYYR